MNKISVSILTISDRSYQKIREDLSGPLLAKRAKILGWDLIDYKIIDDEIDHIKTILMDWADNIEPNIILTTGGTGFSPRDVTPEATKGIITKIAPGLSEAMRAESLKISQHAMLSRGISGIRNKSIIINLPGSPKGAIENLSIVEEVIPHGIKLLLDNPNAEQEH